MYTIYDKWPELAQEYYKKSYEPFDFKDVNHIVFSGMGGSGAIGDLFSAILSKTNIHVSVVKGYLLPKTVDSQTLVVTTSISGNTVETLNILDLANKQECKIISFSDGGKMEDHCKKNKIEHRKIPKIHSPRASFVPYVYSILNILGNFLPIKDSDVMESVESLKRTGKIVSSSNLTEQNTSLLLAEWISGIPIIYYPWGLRAAAIRFKNSLQENAKTHAITENVIETCHNGIVAWEKPANVVPIIIRGEDDYISTKERWEILKEYFKLKNIDYWEVFSVKGNILSKLINLIYLLDYSSIYHAVINKVDPTPISSIDFVKNKLIQ